MASFNVGFMYTQGEHGILAWHMLLPFITMVSVSQSVCKAQSSLSHSVDSCFCDVYDSLSIHCTSRQTDPCVSWGTHVYDRVCVCVKAEFSLPGETISCLSACVGQTGHWPAEMLHFVICCRPPQTAPHLGLVHPTLSHLTWNNPFHHLHFLPKLVLHPEMQRGVGPASSCTHTHISHMPKRPRVKKAARKYFSPDPMTLQCKLKKRHKSQYTNIYSSISYEG